MERHPFVVDLDRKRRHGVGRAHAHIDRAGQRAHDGRRFAGLALQQVEAAAEQLHRHRSAVTRYGFLDALDEEGVDLGGEAGEAVEEAADRVEHALLFRPRQRLQVDLVFGVVAPVGVGAALRPPRPLRHLAHAGDRHDPFGQPRAEADVLVQRHPRHARCVDHVMPFAQFRQEAALQQRQRGEAGGDRGGRRRHRQAVAPRHGAQQAPVGRLQAADQRRRALAGPPAAQQQNAKRRGHGQRHRKRRADRQDVGRAHRKEHASGDARQRQQRDEGQRHDEARVDHRAADLHRGVEHDIADRARRRQRPVLAQAAQGVFGVDDRVVHDLAEGDGQTAQHHDVQVRARLDQHQRGGDQRQRNRGHRDEGRASVEQEGGEDGHHQRRTDRQMLEQPGERTLDISRRTEQVVVKDDAVAFERRRQFGQRGVDLAADGQRVGAELADDHHHHARFADDRRLADGRRRAGDHGGHVGDDEGPVAPAAQHRVRHRARVERLPAAAERQPLRRRVEEAGAARVDGVRGGRRERVERHAVAPQRRRVGLHLPLRPGAAEHVDVHHPGRAEETRRDRPVGEVAQRRRGARRRRQADGHDRGRRRGEGHHRRRGDARRHRLRERRETLADRLPRGAAAHRVPEHGFDHRQTGDRLRAHRPEADQSAQRRLDRQRDEALHLLGRIAGRFGLHDDQPRREFGEDVEADGRQAVSAIAQQERRERGDDAGSPNRGPDRERQHARAQSSSSSRTCERNSSAYRTSAPVTAASAPASSPAAR